MAHMKPSLVLSEIGQAGGLLSIPVRRSKYLSKTFRNSTLGDKSNTEGKRGAPKIAWHVNYKPPKLLLVADAEHFTF